MEPSFQSNTYTLNVFSINEHLKKKTVTGSIYLLQPIQLHTFNVEGYLNSVANCECHQSLQSCTLEGWWDEHSACLMNRKTRVWVPQTHKSLVGIAASHKASCMTRLTERADYRVSERREEARTSTLGLHTHCTHRCLYTCEHTHIHAYADKENLTFVFSYWWQWKN